MPEPHLFIEEKPAWSIESPVDSHLEGVAFSPDGRLIAVTDVVANSVSLFERRGDLQYSSTPVAVLRNPEGRFDYPHDVDFSPDGLLLAVANRRAPSVTVYQRGSIDEPDFGPRPVHEIKGWASRMIYTDGTRFLPGNGGELAAVNRDTSCVNFYPRRRNAEPRFRRRPHAQLRGPRTGIRLPAGLAFSPDGRLLAVTNHGDDSVAIFERAGDPTRYRPEPVAIIRGAESGLVWPHSVAFSPSGAHLAVSSAGGRTLNVFAREGSDPGSWSRSPVVRLPACDPDRFAAQCRFNGQEGGAKGVAFCAHGLVVCGSAIGVRVHRFEERESS